jgi:hypothetical protein
MLNVFGKGKLTEYQGTGAPSGTNFNAGDTYTNLANGTQYVFNGTSWDSVGVVDEDSVDTAAIQDEAVTPAKLGTVAIAPNSEIDGGSDGSMGITVVRVKNALLDGTPNTFYTVPAGQIVYDIVTFVDGGTGDSDTIDVGTGNGGWVLGNNDPNGFIAAQSIQNAVAYRASKLSGALASSGALAATDADLVVTTSSDVSEDEDFGVTIGIVYGKVNSAILGG